MRILTRPNRYKYVTLTRADSGPDKREKDALAKRRAYMSKDPSLQAQEKELAAIKRCLNCPLDTCDEKICRRNHNELPNKRIPRRQ